MKVRQTLAETVDELLRRLAPLPRHLTDLTFGKEPGYEIDAMIDAELRKIINEFADSGKPDPDDPDDPEDPQADTPA